MNWNEFHFSTALVEKDDWPTEVRLGLEVIMRYLRGGLGIWSCKVRSIIITHRYGFKGSIQLNDIGDTSNI